MGNKVHSSMKRRQTPRITEARQAASKGTPPDILNLRRKKFIMLVRQILTAALLAVTAVGAMSQEIDRSETLQARTLAATQAQGQAQGRSRESVKAEVRNLQAQGQLARVGELSEAPVVTAVPDTAYASSLTRAQVKSELAQWRATHKMQTGEIS